ncbi:MAG TPA: glycosyltransferase family 39 protein [Candidatus Udaeobacter sp.]|nr:glycosyltransferase family 39 protein [Candidatus Udaeobacter sp.]
MRSDGKPPVLLTRTAPSIVLVVLIAVFIGTGWIGLDFGYHWDEMFALEEVGRPIDSGVFLPRSYNYGSMIFDIGSVLLLPRTIPFLVKIARESRPEYVASYQEYVPKERAAPLVAFATSKEFLLRMRVVFLLLTSLTGVWVFVTVRAFKRSGWEAVFASAVILTSWEIAYHARWVAPDTIQMQFTALWLMFFALALHSSTRAWLWLRLSAVAAGLACGTKYQGGILLVPVITYSLLRFSTPSASGAFRKAAKEILCNATVFAGVFVISTPGFVLDTLLFCQSLRHVSQQYATGHLGHTVGAVGQHGLLLLVYLTLVLMSHWRVASFMLAALACLGVFILWKERPTTTMLLLCAP